MQKAKGINFAISIFTIYFSFLYATFFTASIKISILYAFEFEKMFYFICLG